MSAMGIPYTKPIPDRPPAPPVEKYSKNDALVMASPTRAAAFARENPRISNGASPETLIPPPAHWLGPSDCICIGDIACASVCVCVCAVSPRAEHREGWGEGGSVLLSDWAAVLRVETIRDEQGAP